MTSPVAGTRVAGLRIRSRSRGEALDAIRALLERPGSHSVYFVHAATASLASRDAEFCSVLNRGDLLLNDGIGIRLAARAAGLALDDNLVGTDLVPLFLAKPTERPLRLYLLGGRPGVAERAAARLAADFPYLEIAGFAHGYFDPLDEPKIVSGIRGAAPDLLLVGMGSPLQESFIDRHILNLRCRVVMSVGGFFDHLSGELRRASPWVRRCRLEWLQLLLQQPRKWRRYLVDIPSFLWQASRKELILRLRITLLMLTSLALALAMAEAGARLVRPQILQRYPRGLYLPSATRQYRLSPHFSGVFRYPEFETSVRINSQGLRAAQDYGPPAAAVHRILAAGDSFTMGYSVAGEQTWVRRLESFLGPRYEVINAGVPGYATWQELTYLQEEGFTLQPRTVLLGFFLGNDIADNAQPSLPIEFRDGALISSGARTGFLPFSLRLALAGHSHLYRLAWTSRRGTPPPPIEPGWLATAGLVDRLARLCKVRGVRLILVLIPAQASPSEDIRRMAELTRRAGVEAVDLSAAMSGRDLYFPQDGHWTPRGNDIAAHAIFEYLSR